MKEFNLEHWSRNWLIERGISEQLASYFTLAIDLVFLALISFLADYITRRIILSFVKTYVKKTKSTYDDVFLDRKVFDSIAHLVPALIIYYSIPWVLSDVAISISLLQKIIVIYMIAIVMIAVSRFLKGLEYIGLHSKRMEGKPVSSYTQVFIIINYIGGTILIISMIISKSPIAILTAFGAVTAVILLIFRDTILGLVASIHISANNMVKLGDWVSIEKYEADGNVIEINLTSVKIRNWDKTITTVPTYAFISDSFKNWRGMETMGIRRIKRSINIDISTIKFVADEMREQYTKFELIRNYVNSRQKEIDEYNHKVNADKKALINGRHMTNLGIFRRYIQNYLIKHSKIDQNEIVMVRHLQPNELGLPLEVYAFSNDTNWLNYEGIQADIFDHLLAAANKFGLRVFQNPSGTDLKNLNLKF